ncbi:uncharacterized protein V6R79_023118 [Siganus canaliculatus]
MTGLTLVLLVLTFTSAAAIRPRSQFTRYPSWNTRMYPVWKDGDVRFRNCWSGGEVTFDLKSDAPTLTGAKTTFSISLNFPPNQTVLSDGQVVWAQNCTINGRQYREGQPVYPDQDTQQTTVFPDGTPVTRDQSRKPRYVFVWKAWGRYWQVADGPSSTLSIGTDNMPLGSYNMEVVIYHCRGKDKFIPLGYASTVFAITDQIPFTMSLAQVNDVNQDDQNFIQNRAIAFSVKLHDPSQYLSNADVSFSWDFGDNTGTLISRDLTVTHTYLAVGTFKPQVVLMASIPNGCGNPTAVVPIDASAAPAIVVVDPSPAAVPAEGGDAIALDVPASDATPLAVSVQPAETAENTEAGEAAADTNAAVVEVASVAPAVVDAAVAPEEQDAADTAADAAAAAAEDTDAAAAEAAGEAAAVASVAPAAEEPADETAAAADETAAAADETAVAADETAVAADETAVAADETAVAADETAVAADAVEENVAEADAAASVAPVAEVEEAAAEGAEAATVAPVAEVTAEEQGDAVAADVAEADAAEATVDAAVDANAAEATAAADADAAAEAAVDANVAEATVDAADAATEVVQAVTEAPADNVVAPAATETIAAEEAVDAAADPEAEVQATENDAAATAAPAEEAVPAEGEIQAEVEADPAQVALVVAKRQAPELTADCMVYRYGSLATSVEVVQGIESVEIVEVSNVVSLATELDQNAVDVTITCQGSLPSEVCTVISDADCVTPLETICNTATPSPDCQMILRQFFNDSGVFCLNVSLTNDVSLAVASARVSVSVASGGSPAGTAATILGVMVLACVVCCIGLMYRRFKQYQPLREDGAGGSSAVTSVPLLLWNLLSRQSPGESRPLLQGRIV